MYYIVYKTTNLINDKIYIGVHKTEDLDDGYLGSGTYINKAIKKYGKENFSKDIIAICDSEEEMYEIEKLLVNKVFLTFFSTYNIMNGGEGGFTHIHEVGALANSIRTRYKEDPEFRHIHQKNLKIMSLKAKSPEARAKRLATFKERGVSKGERNGNFGTKWITTGLENKKIKSSDLVPDGWKLGRKMIYAGVV